MADQPQGTRGEWLQDLVEQLQRVITGEESFQITGSVTTASGSGDQSRPLVFYYGEPIPAFQELPDDGEGQQAATKWRAAHVHLRDNDGAAVGTASNPLFVSAGSVAVKTTFWGSGAGASSTGTAAASQQSILYFLKPASSTKLVILRRAIVSCGGGAGGSFQFRLTRITAENGTPGGTLRTPVPSDPAEASSAVVLRAGATGSPARIANENAVLCVGGGAMVTFDMMGQLTDAGVKPPICRPGIAEGYEIRTIVNTGGLTTASQVSATFVWTEE